VHNTDSDYNKFISANFTIVNIPPQIFPGTVTTGYEIKNIVEGMNLVNVTGEWMWEGIVIDDDLDHFNVTWYNSTWDVIFNRTYLNETTSINTTSDLFRVVGTYYMNVTAIDLGNAGTKIGLSFNSIKMPEGNVSSVVLNVPTGEDIGVIFYVNITTTCGDMACPEVYRVLSDDGTCVMTTGYNATQEIGTLEIGESYNESIPFYCSVASTVIFTATSNSSSSLEVSDTGEIIISVGGGLSDEESLQLETIYNEVKNMSVSLIVGIMLIILITIFIFLSMKSENQFAKAVFILCTLLVILVGLNIAANISASSELTVVTALLWVIYRVALTGFWLGFMFVLVIGIMELKIRKIKRPAFKSPMQQAKENRKLRRGY